MKENPLVSILIPTYNRPHFFTQALESALSQTYKNIEIIITDNSLNNETEDIVNLYRKKNKNIQYIHNKQHLRADLNVQKCLDLSNGEYVNYLFDDDLFHPEKIEKMMNLFFDNPSLTIVTSMRRKINYNGEDLGYMRGLDCFYENTIIIKGNEIIRLSLINVENFIGEPTTVLFKKRALREPIGFFLDRLFINNGDMASWFSILVGEGNLGFLHESLSFFRIHDSQYSNSLKARLGGPLDFLFQSCFGFNNRFLNEDEFLNSIYNILNKLYQVVIKDYKQEKVSSYIFIDLLSQLNNLKIYIDTVKVKYKKNDFAQLFIDNGGGFNEQNSIKINFENMNEGMRLLEFDLTDYKNINNLRFDPLNQQANIEIKKIEFIGYAGEVMDINLNMIFSDALLKMNNIYYFFNNDPKFIIPLINYKKFASNNVKKIKILIDYNKIGYNGLDSIIELIANASYKLQIEN